MYRVHIAASLLAPAVLAGLVTSVRAATDDWSASPEAYFLTRQERIEWKKLRSDESKEAFKTSYWRRRDPTPDTEQNEFRDVVQQRIREADSRYALGKKPGSRTARGLVFVVLGPASVEQQTIGPIRSAPQSTFPGQLTLPRDAFESTEWHVWKYDSERLPASLRTRPSLEFAFEVQPGIRDELQKPDVFERVQELIARHSIR